MSIKEPSIPVNAFCLFLDKPDIHIFSLRIARPLLAFLESEFGQPLSQAMAMAWEWTVAWYHSFTDHTEPYTIWYQIAFGGLVFAIFASILCVAIGGAFLCIRCEARIARKKQGRASENAHDSQVLGPRDIEAQRLGGDQEGIFYDIPL